MTREELITELTPIVRAVFQKPELELTDELNGTNVDTWTSLTFTQLLGEIEKKYGFKFKMMELLKLKNMGAIIDSVLKHTQE